MKKKKGRKVAWVPSEVHVDLLINIPEDAIAKLNTLNMATAVAFLLDFECHLDTYADEAQPTGARLGQVFADNLAKFISNMPVELPESENVDLRTVLERASENCEPADLGRIEALITGLGPSVGAVALDSLKSKSPSIGYGDVAKACGRVHAWLAARAGRTEAQRKEWELKNNLRLDLKALIGGRKAAGEKGKATATLYDQLLGFPCGVFMLITYDFERAFYAGEVSWLDVENAASFLQERILCRLEEVRRNLGPVKRYADRATTKAKLQGFVDRGFISATCLAELSPIAEAMRPPHVMHAITIFEQDGKVEDGDAAFGKILRNAKAFQDSNDAQYSERRKKSERGGRHERERRIRQGKDPEYPKYQQDLVEPQRMATPANPAVIDKFMDLFEKKLLQPRQLSQEIKSYVEQMRPDLALVALDRFEMDLRNRARYEDNSVRDLSRIMTDVLLDLDRGSRDIRPEPMLAGPDYLYEERLRRQAVLDDHAFLTERAMLLHAHDAALGAAQGLPSGAYLGGYGPEPGYGSTAGLLLPPMPHMPPMPPMPPMVRNDLGYGPPVLGYGQAGAAYRDRSRSPRYR
jgi:hypothetical protein